MRRVVSTIGVTLACVLAAAVSKPSSLPPYFTLRVPKFGVVTRVKRVWVASPGAAGLWCGGTLDRTYARDSSGRRPGPD